VTSPRRSPDADGQGRDTKLEAALLVGTLLSLEVIELLRDPDERLTWVDSLAVAAAALARERAHITVPQIAEELAGARQP